MSCVHVKSRETLFEAGVLPAVNSGSEAQLEKPGFAQGLLPEARDGQGQGPRAKGQGPRAGFRL